GPRDCMAGFAGAASFSGGLALGFFATSAWASNVRDVVEEARAIVTANHQAFINASADGPRRPSRIMAGGTTARSSLLPRATRPFRPRADRRARGRGHPGAR